MLCIFAMMPILIFFFLLHYESRLSEDSFETMFGGLYKSLKLQKSGYGFNVAFLIRRLLFAMSIGEFFTSVTIINVGIQVTMSWGMSIYIVENMPFEERKDNFIEIFNELTILSFFYVTLAVITEETVLNGEMRSKLGFIMIVMLLINIAVNFTIFLRTMWVEGSKAVKIILKKCCKDKVKKEEEVKEVK